MEKLWSSKVELRAQTHKHRSDQVYVDGLPYWYDDCDLDDSDFCPVGPASFVDLSQVPDGTLDNFHVSMLVISLSEIVYHWFPLGICLGFSDSILKEIRNKGRNSKTCISEILAMWLRGPEKKRNKQFLQRALQRLTPQPVLLPDTSAQQTSDTMLPSSSSITSSNTAVDQNKYFDVLTVGKTGTGKSTLAREILGINSVLPSSSSITSSTPSTAAYYVDLVLLDIAMQSPPYHIEMLERWVPNEHQDDVPCFLLLELKKKFSSSNFLHLTLQELLAAKNIFPSGLVCQRLFQHNSSGRVTDTECLTVGIILLHVESKVKDVGNMIIYDFGGQPEYYSSHAALLQRYWISFIENACSSAQGSSHVIIVGSHADWVESSRELKEKSSLVESIAESRVKHGGFVNMVGTSPTALIPVLYSKQLISDTDKTRLTTLTHTDNIDKATRLLNAVETKMKAEPRAARVVRELCEAVNDQPALRHVADRITTALDQPAPSTAAPAATPHTPALVQRYIDNLKYHYINKSPILKEKVLMVRPKEFIHLNMVSNETQEEEDNEFKSKCLLLQLYGDVAAIKKKRRPMEMEDIGRSEDQSVPQHILVEGSPGIGKTMFSWELCRQWAEGKMLQDRDIVLMLQLHSKRAKSLSDLFHHSNDSIKQDVLEHITSVDGRGVFLVLEGYDELTEDQRTEGSILNQLLTGYCLPKVSIMVTSRPLASDSLCPEFMEDVDQHVEIVGFNDEDTKSYVQKACQKQPDEALSCEPCYLLQPSSVCQLFKQSMASQPVIHPHLQEVHRFCQQPHQKPQDHKELREYVNKHSVFAGRNPLEVAELKEEDIISHTVTVTQLSNVAEKNFAVLKDAKEHIKQQAGKTSFKFTSQKNSAERRDGKLVYPLDDGAHNTTVAEEITQAQVPATAITRGEDLPWHLLQSLNEEIIGTDSKIAELLRVEVKPSVIFMATMKSPVSAEEIKAVDKQLTTIIKPFQKLIVSKGSSTKFAMNSFTRDGLAYLEKLLSLKENSIPQLPVHCEYDTFSQLFRTALRRRGDKETIRVVSHLLYAVLYGKMPKTFYKLSVHSALSPEDIKVFFEPIIRQAVQILESFKFINRLPKSPDTFIQYRHPATTVSQIYQCSRRALSTEIMDIFKRASACQKELDMLSSVSICSVFMDEVGLAEISHEPPPIRFSNLDLDNHSYPGNQRVAFVGISIFGFDAAKSNLAVSLFRPEISEEDVRELPSACLKGQPGLINGICHMIKSHDFRKYYGIRDFIRFFTYLQRRKRSNDEVVTPQMIMQAIERNFNVSDQFKSMCGCFLKEMGYSPILKHSLADKPKDLSAENEVRYKLIIDSSEDESVEPFLFTLFRVIRMYICSYGETQKVNTIAAIRHSALQCHGHLNILISEAHCKPSCEYNDSNTPLHLACLNGHLNILISEAHCKPSCEYNDSNTLLHLACHYSRAHTVIYLLSTDKVNYYCGFAKLDNSAMQKFIYSFQNGKLSLKEFLPLLHCFFEAQQPPLCQLHVVDPRFLPNEYQKLNLRYLSPVDFLVVVYFITSLLSTSTANTPTIHLVVDGIDEHCLKILPNELSKSDGTDLSPSSYSPSITEQVVSHIASYLKILSTVKEFVLNKDIATDLLIIAEALLTNSSLGLPNMMLHHTEQNDSALTKMLQVIKSLAHLDLSNNSAISDSATRCISEGLQHNTTLVYFNLSSAEFVDLATARSLTKMLQVNSSLTHLDLSNICLFHFRLINISSIFEGLKRNSDVLRILIGINADGEALIGIHTDSVARYVAQALKSNHCLLTLNMSKWKEIDYILELLMFNSTLQTLHVSGIDSETSSTYKMELHLAKKYCSVVTQANKSLKYLNLSPNSSYFFEGLQSDTTILSNNGISAPRSLTTWLQVSKSFTHLDLSNNSAISDSAARCISEGLQHNTTLVYLNLSSAKCVDLATAKSLNKMLQVNNSLTHLDLSNNCLFHLISILQGLRCNSDVLRILIGIDADGEALIGIHTDSVAKYVAQALKSNYCLRTLTICMEFCLCEGLQSNITLVKLSSNTGIIAAMCRSLTKLLRVKKSLAYLDLSSNLTSDSLARCILEGLQHNTTLVDSNLSQTGIPIADPVTARSLTTMLRVNKSLTHFDLSRNIRISGSVARFIFEDLQHNSTLVDLNLSQTGIAAVPTRFIPKFNDFQKLYSMYLISVDFLVTSLLSTSTAYPEIQAIISHIQQKKSDPSDSDHDVIHVEPVNPNDAMRSLGVSVTMEITIVGTQGYPGIGKTSVLDLALGKDPAPTRTSTDCVDPPSRYLMIDSATEGVEWENVTTDKMFKMVCGAMKKTIEEDPSDIIELDDPTATVNHSTSNTEHTSSVATLQIPPPTANDSDQTSDLLSSFNFSPQTSYSGFTVFPELLKKLSTIESSGVIFNSHWMMVTDCGGQPPFLDAAALFLQNSCLQIFPVKLNDQLNKTPEFSYFLDGTRASFDEDYVPLTHKQIIETLAKSVASIQPPYTPSATKCPKGAKFTIVGTFEDEAHECSETVDEKESVLKEVLEPYKSFQVQLGKKAILPINAVAIDTQTQKERTESTNKLRRLIKMSDVTMKVDVKLRWFGFLLSLLTIAEKENKAVLTLDECYKLGESLGMDKLETKEAIRFFHDINLIMHFDTPKLRDSVIIDTKPVLNKLSRLISVSFLDEQFLADHYKIVLPSGAKELLQYHGRFSRDTLDKCVKFTEPITLQFFLDILEHIRIAVVINKESTEYFMPCALSYAPEASVSEPSPPWLIRLRMRRGVEDVYIPIPVGYLPTVVVFLLTEFSSQFSTDHRHRQCRNVIKLRYKRGGFVYLIERHLQLEICFSLCEQLPQECATIRDLVLESIRLTEEKLHIIQEGEGSITKVDSFLCSCGKGSAHHTCAYNPISEILECEETRESCKLGRQQLRWLLSVDQETKKIEYQQLLGVLEQTRKMSRARDVLISNLEKDNEILHEKLQKSTLNCTSNPVSKAVSSNYLNKKPAFPQGISVYKETVFEFMGDKPQKLEWAGYGIYIEVPEGALPPGVTASVTIKVIADGQFQFPENRQLISALYWVSSSEEFLKELSVNIEHCAVIKNEDQCSTFKFIIVKSSDEVLPYRFREREGVFNPHTQYGAFNLKQLSLVGVTAPADTETYCTALMFYKLQMASPLFADFHFVVIKDLELFLQNVYKEYQRWKKDSHTLRVCFNGKTTLLLDQQEEVVDSWKILPLSSSKITNASVSYFTPGRIIPHCAFELQLIPGKPLQQLLHKVDIVGVSSLNSFYIRYPLPNDLKRADMAEQSTTTQLPTATTGDHSRTLTVNDLCDVLEAVDDLDDWMSLGLKLGLLYPTLQRIAEEQRGNISQCKLKMMVAWLQQQDMVTHKGVPSLSAPVKIGEHKLADRISNCDNKVLRIDPSSVGSHFCASLPLVQTDGHRQQNANRPTYNQLIQINKTDGSNLKVIQWITSLEQWQCTDFAHLLLKDEVLVSKYKTECKGKDEFVQKILKDWLSRDDDRNDSAAPRTWAALAECVTDAGLPETLARAILDMYFPSG